MFRFLAKLRSTFQRPAARSKKRTGTAAQVRLEKLEERAVMTLTVPALNSLVGAPATIYLDFDGNIESSWQHYAKGNGSPLPENIKPYYQMQNGQPGIRTPAFDIDGNPNDFNSEELTAINNIWQRVAEDYAPFNINVTTANPGSFANKTALHVVIGGSVFDWEYPKPAGALESYAAPASGDSSIGSFTDSMPNVVFVFSNTIREFANTPFYKMEINSLGLPVPVLQYGKTGDGLRVELISAVANTITHETGHAFGLHHIPGFRFDGTSTNYNPGDRTWTPLMGENLASDRTKWSYATNDWGIVQDDMALIGRKSTTAYSGLGLSSINNGFGYRPQDHGQYFMAADPLAVTMVNSWYTYRQGAGVIGNTRDTDYFTFNTNGGSTNISVNVAAVGANLDATVQIFKLTYSPQYGPMMTFITYADPSDSLSVSLTLSLQAGTYYVVVGSKGAYGDVGQYTVSATSWNPYPMASAPRAMYQASTPVVNTTPQSATMVSSLSFAGGVANAAGGAAPGMATAIAVSSNSTPLIPAERGRPARNDHTPSHSLATARREHVAVDLCATWLEMQVLNEVGQKSF